MLLLVICEAFFHTLRLRTGENGKETAANKCNGDKPFFFVAFAIRLSSMEFVEDLKYVRNIVRNHIVYYAKV